MCIYIYGASRVSVWFVTSLARRRLCNLIHPPHLSISLSLCSPSSPSPSPSSPSCPPLLRRPRRETKEPPLFYSLWISCESCEREIHVRKRGKNNIGREKTVYNRYCIYLCSNFFKTLGSCRCIIANVERRESVSSPKF